MTKLIQRIVFECLHIYCRYATLASDAHRIHVWCIFLHLVDFSDKCRQIYNTWILWSMLWYSSQWHTCVFGSFFPHTAHKLFRRFTGNWWNSWRFHLHQACWTKWIIIQAAWWSLLLRYFGIFSTFGYAIRCRIWNSENRIPLNLYKSWILYLPRVNLVLIGYMRATDRWVRLQSPLNKK